MAGGQLIRSQTFSLTSHQLGMEVDTFSSFIFLNHSVEEDTLKKKDTSPDAKLMQQSLNLIYKIRDMTAFTHQIWVTNNTLVSTTIFYTSIFSLECNILILMVISEWIDTFHMQSIFLIQLSRFSQYALLKFLSMPSKQIPSGTNSQFDKSSLLLIAVRGIIHQAKGRLRQKILERIYYKICDYVM